jgi:hypothetical protein
VNEERQFEQNSWKVVPQQDGWMPRVQIERALGLREERAQRIATVRRRTLRS